jgi:hypothetical protein
MEISQHFKQGKIFCRASPKGRLGGGLVFLGVLVIFVLLRLASANIIDICLLVGPCGFKQRYSLPCPTCGWTTSAIVFARGHIVQSYYIQPAAALICSLLAVAGFFALLQAALGVYWRFLDSFCRGVRVIYVIAAFGVVVLAGWAVTLARALAAR